MNKNPFFGQKLYIVSIAKVSQLKLNNDISVLLILMKAFVLSNQLSFFLDTYNLESVMSGKILFFNLIH